MVKEVLLLSDKKHPGKHNTEKCYRWQIGHHHEGTDEEPTFSCREPGEECVVGLILCKGHALEAKLEGQISCWDEMLFHVDLWSREASRRERPNVVRLLKDQRVEAASAMHQDGHRRLRPQELLGRRSRRHPGEGNVVVSMPRGLLGRLGEGPMGALSERETEVVVLAARGLPNARIAEELHVAEATVKRHLANIYEKVGVHSRTEVVRTALVEQWIGIHEIAAPASADGDGSPSG
jgi:DNA-binding CsgD family transcriptional regulator